MLYDMFANTAAAQIQQGKIVQNQQGCYLTKDNFSYFSMKICCDPSLEPSLYV